MALPRFIAIEGPIGVGKTTLACKLAATLQAELLLERYDNPFLDAFYRDGQSAALATQLHFLLMRAQQWGELQERDLTSPLVADFMPSKDRLFAVLNLTARELALYDQMAAELRDARGSGHAVPDLVIWLDAPVEILLERIAKRGRPMESDITAEYLQRLRDAYARHFAASSDLQVLRVDGTDEPLGQGERAGERLLELLLAGRQRAPS